MTELNAYNRQPTKQDYASPTQFKVSLSKLPKVEYFCTAVNLPGVSVAPSEQLTPIKNIFVPGDKLFYEDLSLSFIVDENLENYQEIYDWITQIGKGDSYDNFTNLRNEDADRFPTANRGDQAGVANDIGSILSDATLTILSSKNNPVRQVIFQDLFPASVSGLQYNQQTGDINYLTATVLFKFSFLRFVTL